MGLLTEIEVANIPNCDYLAEADREPGGTGDLEYEDYVPMLQAQHNKTLSKITEAVDGAGLTDEEIQEAVNKYPPVWELNGKQLSKVEILQRQHARLRAPAQAQLQAIKKAIEEGE